MILIFGRLAGEVSAVVISLLVSAAKDAGAKSVLAALSHLLSGRGLNREIQRAIQHTFERWSHEVNDPDLVETLKRIPEFHNDRTVIMLLAEEAVTPEASEQHVSALGARLHNLMPAISRARCRHAAEVLIADLHDEAAKIKRLRHQLERSEFKNWFARLLPLPPYQDGLEQAIIQKADEIQRELGHGYIMAAHLLYALMVLPEELGRVARVVLLGYAVSGSDIRVALARKLKPHTDGMPGEKTVGVTDALEDAQRIARERGARETHGVHVLESLAVQATQYPGGSVAAIFKSLRLLPEEVQAEAIRQGQNETGVLVSEMRSDTTGGGSD